MIKVMQTYPLATLISAVGSTPYATHIPIMYDATSDSLIAHIDAHNPQVATLQEGNLVTAIFKGPDTYISPATYKSKQLPTWNYIIVHISGKVRRITEPKEIKESLIHMTAFLEGKSQRFELEESDRRMERLLPYIETFEIIPESWEGKFKLSQDKNQEDFLLAKQALLDKEMASRKNLIEFIYSVIKE